ncbi:MAG: YqgE/AlgH family protein [Bacteroidota bacterium]
MPSRAEILKPKVGALLISEPFNPEPNFKRSVVLVSQHDRRGTIGFILNKPTPLLVSEAMEGFPDFRAVVYWGGPLRLDSIYYVHKLKHLAGSKKISEDLYWGGDFEQLKLMIETGVVEQNDIKFIAGFAAWIPNQLQEEIKSENWWVTEADSYSTLVEEPTVVWGNVLRRMGHVYGILNDFPEDPGVN